MALPLDTVKRFYALLAAADVRGALSLLHPQVEWREAKRSPYFAGTLRGVDAVVAGVLRPITADFDAFVTRPTDFMSDGSRVVSMGVYEGVSRKTGRHLSAPFVHLWSVEGDRLRSFMQFTDSTAWREPLLPP
jgi:ketosteroid isomerase-like protein